MLNCMWICGFSGLKIGKFSGYGFANGNGTSVEKGLHTGRIAIWLAPRIDTAAPASGHIIRIYNVLNGKGYAKKWA